MKQTIALNSRITPDFYIDPELSNTKKRDTYELLARIKVSEAPTTMCECRIFSCRYNEDTFCNLKRIKVNESGQCAMYEKPPA